MHSYICFTVTLFPWKVVGMHLAYHCTIYTTTLLLYFQWLFTLVAVIFLLILTASATFYNTMDPYFSVQELGTVQGQIQGDALGAQAPPPPTKTTYRLPGLNSHPPSSKEALNWHIFDYKIILINLCIGIKCRVPLTPPCFLAVSLVSQQLCGCGLAKGGMAKSFMCDYLPKHPLY